MAQHISDLEEAIQEGLRRIDDRVHGVIDDLRDLAIQIGAAERKLAHVSWRFRRVETQLERIERRLDSVELIH